MDVSFIYFNIQVYFEFGSAQIIFNRVMPLELRKKEKFTFRSLSKQSTVAHIQLKYKICMCHMNIQVEFEFGSGPMIFGRVMPFEL